MDKTIRTFLSGIIDYAGTFPPAELSLTDAMEEYVKYRHSKYDWMLSRFIVSINHFQQLRELCKDNHSFPDPLRISVTTSSSENTESFLELIERVREEILQLHQDIPQSLNTKILEIKLPDTIADLSAQQTLDLVSNAVQLFSDHPLLPDFIFLEAPGFSFDIQQVKKVIDAVSVNNKTIQLEKLSQYKCSGFKIRCGGVESFQFPPTDYLAEAILNSKEMGIPLKFTAGLHHPFRHYNEKVQTKMHGFINVFGAGILAYANKLSEPQVVEILEDENTDNFSFTKNEFSWKDVKVSSAIIEKIRKHSLISFGSCSMTEPVDDLKNLGFIE